jgi:hypothetical protein
MVRDFGDFIRSEQHQNYKENEDQLAAADSKHIVLFFSKVMRF